MSDNMQFLQTTIEQLRHQLALEQAKVKAMEEALKEAVILLRGYVGTRKEFDDAEIFKIQKQAEIALDSLSVDKEDKI